jgi:hypothetical protein
MRNGVLPSNGHGVNSRFRIGCDGRVGLVLNCLPQQRLLTTGHLEE